MTAGRNSGTSLNRFSVAYVNQKTLPLPGHNSSLDPRELSIRLTFRSGAHGRFAVYTWIVYFKYHTV
ncbi:MAG TPA: hypothetical protein VI636_19460 [Candidatus Angelobacter sp.]